MDISVVIPSYNHALYIQQAVESVFAQTFKNWELIVVDDGSTDATRALLDKSYAGHPQISLIYQTNQGAHQALNTAMGMAKGRYISILNSDDVYHPDRLQTLLAHCDKSSCGLAFTPLSPIDAQGAPLMDPVHPWRQLYARLMQEYEQAGPGEALLTGNFAVTTSNFFFRADLIKALGGFSHKRYNHDWDFMARLFRQGLDIVRVGDRPLLSYRLHDRNTITQNTLMARLELKQILRSMLPPQDPYLAKWATRMQINLRSIRREHQARLLAQVRAGYDTHIQNMLVDLEAQHAVQLGEVQQANQALTDLSQRLQQQTQALQAQCDTLQQQCDSLHHQKASLEEHLTLIHNSRSYRFAQRLSRLAASLRNLWHSKKIDDT
jgi:glycosyltransferase involved in cell wall biosynthesis